MPDNRRMTTDRFYGGVTNRLQNLQSMLEYVRDNNPSRSQLNNWVISNTRANSSDAVSHHLAFLQSIGLVKLSETECELDYYGEQWLSDPSSETLYEALSSRVKGFDTLLQSLQDGPMTDEDMMNLLVEEFDEAEMTKPGPAIRHREWLQVLGFIERENEVNKLTANGQSLIEAKEIGAKHQLLSGTFSIGDYLSKEEIEEAFNTGFGYRISGINPRRDEQDQRYILLFANEDGPYNDAVTQGRFEYIGEGLEGNQTESSPGNSTLIDAITSQVPVYFFYKRIGIDGWEYQGLVNVLDYDFREQGGREVIVFEMEHQDETPEEDNLSWLDAMRLELERYEEQKGENIVTAGELYDFSEQRLSIQFPDNDQVRAKIRQQLQRLRDRDEVEFLDEQGTYRINVGNEVKQEETELEQALDLEPRLTEDSTEFTESRRRARDHAFAELVKDAYDYSCAICGSSRETPAGNPEVEAAHIYPKREGGSDDVRNGLTLCKLHHWAFDTGWLSISDEYEVLVKEEPRRNGYNEFKKLEGNEIRLPETENMKPHPIFLTEHRQLNGFNHD